MLRKLLKLIRALFIGTLWTYVFLVLANILLFYVWNFNIISARSWQTISYFWQGGGIIKTSKDYVFLLTLLILPFIWIFGWRYFNSVNYADFFLYPIIAYNRRIIRKYGHDSSRILLRNLKSSHKAIEEVKQQLDSIKPEAPKEVSSIREEIQKRIESETTKY